MYLVPLPGTAPFKGDPPIAVADQHLSDDVPAPSSRASGIPRELDDLVQRATARNPADRFADGREMHAALVQARDRLGLHGVVPAPPADNTVNLSPHPPAVSLIPDRNRTV